MHRNVLDQLLKFFASGNKIALAIYFDQYTYLPAHVDVRTNGAFRSYATGLFTRLSHPLFAKDLHRGCLIAA
jgi:hypothetical protein